MNDFPGVVSDKSFGKRAGWTEDRLLYNLVKSLLDSEFYKTKSQQPFSAQTWDVVLGSAPHLEGGPTRTDLLSWEEQNQREASRDGEQFRN